MPRSIRTWIVATQLVYSNTFLLLLLGAGGWSLLNHQEAIVFGTERGGDLDKLDAGQVMDLSLGSAVVVAGAVEGNALPARASNLLQVFEDGLCCLCELTTGDTVVSVGFLEVLVVLECGQSLDEGQVACHDVGRGGSDDAGEGDGEKLHFLLIIFGGLCWVKRDRSLVVVE
ncbi:MAG: hypothetical protein BYD32DRAFT_40467 [Podila humilis]|nr:MAG: hypothetical protein BYD32DRAFT_40467 [Podila humilis]